MYSTCISCHAPLGANAMIEHFPVGRKLAFDQAHGRLWAVCSVCRQWNLAALDERWEAIEEAERLFRDARLRVSTDQIGLARIADGTELIRVGKPQRPEFAAWRYGDRFAARWRWRGPMAAVGAGVVAVTKFAPIIVTSAASVPLIAFLAVRGLSALVRKTRAVAQLAHPNGTNGTNVRLTQAHLDSLTFRRDNKAENGWALRVQHPPVWSGAPAFQADDPTLVLTGLAATRAAAQLLPRINRTGGRRSTVAEAISVLDRSGDSNAVFRLASRWDAVSRERSRFGRIDEEAIPREDDGQPLALVRAPAAVRLAVEMAAHEEQERQLMNGELAALESQWREAEEIAAIADDLTLSPAILRQLDRLRLR